jgi:TRAP-type C4-dicarboxylate transport system permease small subunit
MKLAKLIEFLRNRLKTVVWVCAAALALLVLWDATLVDKSDAHTGVERLPMFWALFGFIGCALIIILSKWYGHAGIMTREDYYEAPEEKEDVPHD